jgi:hypothetical protein
MRDLIEAAVEVVRERFPQVSEDGLVMLGTILVERAKEVTGRGSQGPPLPTIMPTCIACGREVAEDQLDEWGECVWCDVHEGKEGDYRCPCEAYHHVPDICNWCERGDLNDPAVCEL